MWKAKNVVCEGFPIDELKTVRVEPFLSATYRKPLPTESSCAVGVQYCINFVTRKLHFAVV